MTASGVLTTSPQIAWSYPTLQSAPVVSIAPPRYSAGQWAFTWLFALAGGGFAWLFAWRTAPAASKETKPASVPGGKP